MKYLGLNEYFEVFFDNYMSTFLHFVGTDELHVKLPGRGEESPSLRARGLRGQHGHHHNYSSTNSSTPQSRSKAGRFIWSFCDSMVRCSMHILN